MDGLHPLMQRLGTRRTSATPARRQWILNCSKTDSDLLRRVGTHSTSYHVGDQREALLVDQICLCCANAQRWTLYIHHPVLAGQLHNNNIKLLAVVANALFEVKARCSEQRLGTKSEMEFRLTSGEVFAEELRSRHSVQTGTHIPDIASTTSESDESVRIATSGPETAGDVATVDDDNQGSDEKHPSTSASSSTKSLTDLNNVVDEIAEDLLEALDIMHNLQLNMSDLAEEMQHLADVYGGRHTVATARRHGVQTFQEGAEVFAQGVRDFAEASGRARRAFNEGMRVYRESKGD